MHYSNFDNKEHFVKERVFYCLNDRFVPYKTVDVMLTHAEK